MSTERVFCRVWNALSFASVTLADDTGAVMMLQTTTGAGMTAQTLILPAPQQFGFSSVPPNGSDSVGHFIAGDVANGVVTATNHQPTRPRNKNPGESQQYDAFGKSIYLTQNGGIIVNANGTTVTVNNATTVTINASAGIVMNTPTLTVNGAIAATGDITAGSGAASSSLLKHEHTAPADGGTTSAPIAGT